MNDRPVRLSPVDLLGLGLLGIRTRKMRAALSALGIAIGIATLVVVAGIPASSRLALNKELAKLGVNVLQATAAPGHTPPVTFPPEATAMVARVGPVTSVGAVGNTHATIARTDRQDPTAYAGIAVLAVQGDLLGTVNGMLLHGRAPDARLPTIVLGAIAAKQLGYAQTGLVYVNRRWFTLVGILAPNPLAPELDRAALVGWEAARSELGFDGRPTVVYLRAREARVETVRDVLANTIYPGEPASVLVSRPSDALAAKRASDNAFSSLLLGLAGVALLVGGVGVANTMVVSVLERRQEIGLRRALGANRGQIRAQFLLEAVLLSALGGIAGVLLGALATVGYAAQHGWTPVIPSAAIAAGLGGAVVVGALAGLYPSGRAARLAPTRALAAT